MATLQKVAADQLFLQLGTGPTGTPKFAMLLGAGASATSGIRTGWTLVEEWRKAYEASTGRSASECDWHDSPSEYGELFEHFYQNPAQRRAFIETCVKDATPSWGYLYLADLLERGYFNVVLTTNFDDLLTEACYSFTPSLRPLVCSHDGSLRHFRMTSTRPKILKLHGDYLFDNIKNTPNETAILESNTSEKVRWIGREYGLIVVGYSGCDDSVMKVICQLLDEGAFPNGLYWCIKKGQKAPLRLSSYHKHPHLRFVEIESFDEFMADAHQSTVGVSPTIITSPFKYASDRLSHLLTMLGGSSQAMNSNSGPIQRDLSALGDALAGTAGSPIRYETPPALVGTLHFIRRQYERAIPLLSQPLAMPGLPVTSGQLIMLYECFRYHWDQTAFEEITTRIESAMANNANPISWLFTPALSLIHAKKYDEASRLLDIAEKALLKDESIDARNQQVLDLNRLQIKVHRGGALSHDDIVLARNILTSPSSVQLAFGCRILLGEHDEALTLVKQTPTEFPPMILDWPITQLLPLETVNKIREVVGEPKPHFGNIQMQFNVPLRLVDQAA